MQALSSMSYRATNLQAGTDLLLSTLVLAGMIFLVSAAASDVLGLGDGYPWIATSAFGITATVVWLLARRASEFKRFGAANRVTLLRVSLIVPVAATFNAVPNLVLSWTIIGVVTTALILDGFDGHIARRTNSSSSFGARFDMETDAALVMVLSVLSWQFGKAGIWILAAGAMRYLFVVAARILPWMRAPLPYSRRRQTICILQSAFLLGVISPVFPLPFSAILAAGTLAMLSTSFFIDIRWLWAQRRRSPQEQRLPWRQTQEPSYTQR